MRGIIRGRTMKVYGTMRRSAMSVYSTMSGRATKVYGTMRRRAMRVYDTINGDGHEGVWHHEGRGP